MKVLRKALKITGIVLLSLIVLAFLIPVLFKKQITNLVKKEINNSLTAKVDFADVNLSLLRHFPKLTIVLKDFSIVGTGEFEKDTLISAKSIDASANIFSVIKGKDIKIYGAYLKSPRIHALVNKDGKANWDIAKESGSSDTSSAPSSFKMSLKEYEINDGYIEYRDESSNTYTEWQDVDHTGSGDFTLDEFTLSTVTHAKEASLVQDGIPYLANTKTDIVTDIKIDTKTNTYTFKTDEINLNDLKLAAEGFFQLLNDSTYSMDIKFRSPENDFKSILSMIPAVYKQDFNKIKTSGEATFNGFVKGVYSPSQMPAYDVTMQIRNGSFQYPDLPKPVKNIGLDFHAVNPDGLPDNAVIDISKGHLEMDNEPFDFKFIFKNPETAKYIDAVVKGKLDLSQVSQFIKLENQTKLSGMVQADAYAKGNMSAIGSMKGPFNAGGYFNVTNLFYSSKDFPQPISNGNMNIRLDNTGGIADKTVVNISSGHLQVGNDPVDFALQLSNPVSTMNFAGNAKGSFTLDHVKQFTSFDPGTSLSGILNADLKFSGNKELISKGDYDKIKMDGAASLNNVKYITSDYPTGITFSNVAASFNPPNITISDFAGNYLGSNFSGNGTLNNLISFIVRNAPLNGTINASVDKMNLNDWMGTEEQAATETVETSSASANSSPFLVPANMDISLNVKAGQVTYDKVNYNNINGNLSLKDETVKFKDVSAEALDGSILINGSYSTRTNKTKPDIGLGYTIKDVDVQKAFLSYNTIKAIMPIGKFLSGKLNSELTMTGNLGSDMMPVLNSLTGKGNLLLIEGVLKKFAPLEKIATLLQVDRLKSISVKDIKNYFEFTNGKVLVKPFNVKVEDIDMQIGGTHGFDQSIDYIIAMKLPRNYLGSQGNNLINGLVTQASSKGIPIKLGDMIDLNIKVGGTLSNPAIKIDLEQVVGNAVEELKQQAEEFVKEKMDSLKEKAKDTLQSFTDKIKDTLKQKLKDQIFGKDTSNKNNQPDTSKKQPADNIKKTLKDIFNRNKKPKDSI